MSSLREDDMTPNDLEKRQKLDFIESLLGEYGDWPNVLRTRGWSGLPGSIKEAWEREGAADYIAQLQEELAEAKNPDVRTVVSYEAGYEDGKREAEAERDRLRGAIKQALMHLHADRAGFAVGRAYHAPGVEARKVLESAAALQTGADK